MVVYGTEGLDLSDADSPFISAIACISVFSFFIARYCDSNISVVSIFALARSVVTAFKA